MARLPTEEDLGIRNPQAVPSAVKTFSTGRALQMDLKAQDQTASKQGIQELQDRISNEELATAEVQFQLGAMAEAEKYRNDTDLDTIDERHAAGMQEVMAKASAHITSAKAREMFVIRGEEGMAKANAAMANKTNDRRNDREKGYMANAIDAMVKGGMDLEYGDPGEAALGIQLSLDSMVERGVISNVDAQQTLRKAQLDMAYGRLKSMSPEMQLEMLNSEDPKIQAWVEDVPPDTLRQLREQAEQQGIDDTAQGFAMQTRGMDTADALDMMYIQAEKEDWNADRIDSTRVRILRIQQDDEVMHQKALEDYYEEGAASIYFGETTLEQLESTPKGVEMLKKMTEGQRRNLRIAQDNAILRQNGEGRRHSDGAVTSKLKQMLANGQEIEARKYWSENYASLNDADFRFYDRRTSPTKSTDPTFKPVQTTHQVMSDYLDQHPLDEEGTTKIWNDLSDQAAAWSRENEGKTPDQALVQQWVRDKHSEIVLEKPTTFLGFEFGGETVLQRDMTPEQKREVIPITNVYQSAGMTGQAAANEFNALSPAERAEFKRKRLQNPDMDPIEFLGKFNRGIKAARARLDLGRREGMRGRGFVQPDDAGA